MELISRHFLDQGYRTNYVSSWILSRGGVSIEANGQLLTSASLSGLPKVFFGRSGTLGPLSAPKLDAASVRSSSVPFLGCGGPAPLGNGLAETDFSYQMDQIWSRDSQEHRTFISSGEMLASDFPQGPPIGMTRHIG